MNVVEMSELRITEVSRGSFDRVMFRFSDMKFLYKLNLKNSIQYI